MDSVMANGHHRRYCFRSRRQQGLPSLLSCFSLGDVAFAATTSKLDKDLHDDKVR